MLSRRWGVFRAGAIRLLPSAYAALILKVWVPKIDGWTNITAFMLTGLCAEEFLFRGGLYTLAQRVFGDRMLLRPPSVSYLYSDFLWPPAHTVSRICANYCCANPDDIHACFFLDFCDIMDKVYGQRL